MYGISHFPFESTLGLPYDFHSVMHYRWESDMHSSAWTLRPRSEYIAIAGKSGGGRDLSPLDIRRANLLYAVSVQHSVNTSTVTVQVTLTGYFTSARTAKGKRGCATLPRSSPNQKCRIFFREHARTFGSHEYVAQSMLFIGCGSL